MYIIGKRTKGGGLLGGAPATVVFATSSVQHEHNDVAEKEASRLAGFNPGWEFLVFQLQAGYQVSPPPPPPVIRKEYA